MENPDPIREDVPNEGEGLGSQVLGGTPQKPKLEPKPQRKEKEFDKKKIKNEKN